MLTVAAMSFHHTSSPTASATLQLLLATHPVLLSRGEIEREMADPREGERGTHNVADALAHFERLGMVHRLEDAAGREFFWPTRTAMASEEGCTAFISGEAMDDDS